MFYNLLIYDIMSSDIVYVYAIFLAVSQMAPEIRQRHYTRKHLGRQDINAMNFEENLRYNNDYKRAKKFQDLPRDGRE